MTAAAPTKLSEDGFDRVDLFGYRFINAPTISCVVSAVLDPPPMSASTTPIVITPNTDLLLHLLDTNDRDLADLCRSAWCVLPDGQPIVWASLLLGVPLRSRLTGSDLFANLWPQMSEQRTPVVVLAATTEIAEGLQQSHRDAGVLIAPVVDPSVHGDIVAVARRCAEEAIHRGARTVMLGLGHPKDALIAREIVADFAAANREPPIVLCLGGSAEMYLGIRRRAPRWLQACGGEWLFRFVQEPRRLFHRYFIRDIRFIPIVWNAYRHHRQPGSTEYGR